MIPEKRRGLLFLYQRAMFYSGVALAEIGKPLQLRNEAVYVVLLAAAYGFKIPIFTMAVAYIILFIILIIVGKIIIKIGMMRYNTTLGNYQNIELMSVVDKLNNLQTTVDEIKQHLDEKK